MSKDFNEYEKNRTRQIQKLFRVTEEELSLIEKKMELSGYENFNDYIVRMAIDGFVIIQDYSVLIEVGQMLHDIGSDINKIAHRADLIDLQEEQLKRGAVLDKLEEPITLEDIKRIDKHMEKIWKALNKIIRDSGEKTPRRKIRKELSEQE